MGVLRARGVELRAFAEALRAAGVSLVQLRDKTGSPQEVLAAAAILRDVFLDGLLIMNDRADLAVMAGFDGVHVGQGDLSPEEAKTVVCWPQTIPHPATMKPSRGWGTRVVGVSTHTEEQVRAADATDADYIAIGPVFATGTKADAEAVVGLDGVRRARALTRKPLVAIGGITRENCRSVVDAGADSVAVISGLFGAGEPVEKVARDFLAILR
jgi:thiamine-phosphate pyrophosphorylase